MFAKHFRMFSIVAALLCLAVATVPAMADPLPGRDILKFQQLPMDGTKIPSPDGTVREYFGHDELSTAYSVTDAAGNVVGYNGVFMADDFADRFDTPVVHVRWWGSYIDNQQPQPVDRFLISFESDIPADQNPVGNFSRPGDPLLNQIVRRGPLAPGSGTFTEVPISPGGPPLDERLYEYNAELHLGKEFFQKPDTVYWLKIVALVDAEPNLPPTARTRWGWHNRDYTIMDPLASVAPAVIPGEHVQGILPPDTRIWHFQDDAVTGRVFIDTHSTSDGQIMPLIEQFEHRPTFYEANLDGPDLIGQFSKDLAFELYTVPEPMTTLLLAGGAMMLAAVRRRG